MPGNAGAQKKASAKVSPALTPQQPPELPPKQSLSLQAFPEAADEQHDKGASHLAAAADRPPPTSSKISPLLMLKRGAQNGDCDMIRDAVDAGADINHRETGEDDGAKDDDSDDDSKSKEEENDSSASSAGKYKAADGDDAVRPAGDDGDDDDEKKLSKEELEQQRRDETKAALEKVKNMSFRTLDSALHLAAQNGHVEASSLLLRLGANLEIKNKIGSTPLHVAISAGKHAVIALFLKFAAQVDAVNRVGSSALHVAIYMQNLASVRMLLQHLATAAQRRAAMETLNRAGMLPIDYALPKVREIIASEFPELGIKLLPPGEGGGKGVSEARSPHASSSASSSSTAASAAASTSSLEADDDAAAARQRALSLSMIAVNRRPSGMAGPPNDGDGLLL